MLIFKIQVKIDESIPTDEEYNRRHNKLIDNKVLINIKNNKKY